jgi:hypothetical protein
LTRIPDEVQGRLAALARNPAEGAASAFAGVAERGDVEGVVVGAVAEHGGAGDEGVCAGGAAERALGAWTCCRLCRGAGVDPAIGLAADLLPLNSGLLLLIGRPEMGND